MATLSRARSSKPSYFLRVPFSVLTLAAFPPVPHPSSDPPSQGLLEGLPRVPSRPATDAELLLAHSPEHIALVDSKYGQLKAQGLALRETPQGDIYWSQGTALAARLAAGCVTEAALGVKRGLFRNAFAVVRPPGHHAGCSCVSGFCFFNNVAVAAKAALADGLERVCIVDWDVHHGDGTQAILENDPRVLYISLHRFEPKAGFFPGTGAADSTGTDAGRGFSVNLPLTEKEATASDYLAAFRFVVQPILHAFAPQLVLISAGYDAAEGDPLGGMLLKPPAYAEMTSQLMKFAEGRVVVALEGGYNQQIISACAAATVRALMGQRDRSSTTAAGVAKPVKHSTEVMLKQVVAIQTQFWPGLGSAEFKHELTHFLSVRDSNCN